MMWTYLLTAGGGIFIGFGLGYFVGMLRGYEAGVHDFASFFCEQTADEVTHVKLSKT